MDPNANLEEQLRLAEAILDEGEEGNRLAELVLALDEWIRRGGFLPEAWGKR